MSIFDINWRKIFEFIQPPVERAEQTLDLGESLTSTLQIDSDEISQLFDQSTGAITNTCVKMVMQELLNVRFNTTGIIVETATGLARNNYFYNESEMIPQFLFNESEQEPFYFFNESEVVPLASIIVRVPALLFASSFNQIDAYVKFLKVAGKTYTIVSL